MILNEYSTPIIPLSECKIIKINYDGEILTIPNQIILNELIVAPLPINYLINPNKDKKLSFFLQDLSRKTVNEKL